MKKTSPNTISSSSLDLPDINIWLALIDKRHAHHAAAAHYWNEQAAPRLGLSRVTMLGFLRLSTSLRVLSNPLSPKEAWEIYDKFMALPEVGFLAEPATVDTHFRFLTAAADLPHRMWTDAYLAAFARATGARLVSFDADFHRFPGLNFLHLTA